ncbi:MAG: DNA repair protein RecO [Actinomycetota bacterium]|nr:DNA repair protein RecO [Actinomycetota bacterium]
MAAYSVRAIVLRKTKLGETDVILSVLAEDGRQIRAVAKGMRKPGSRTSGRLEPFSEVDLLVHSGRSLDVISEVEVLVAHARLREDLDRSAAASVVADVLDKISLEGQIEERLFSLAQVTLASLESGSLETLCALVTAFLVKAMAMQGYRPQLEACAACSEHVSGGKFFSLASGGVLCAECGDADSSALRLSEAGRVLLVRLLRSTMADIAEMPPPEADVREAFELMRSFVAYHLHARLKALDFYAGLLT